MSGLQSRFMALVARTEEDRPAPPAVLPIEVPPDDDAESTADGEAMGFGAAEGQYLMIEYVDSRGQPSRRRITVWSITPGSGGIPCLRAQCHERRATRTFRIDRIQSVIDLDGEIHDDVAVYLGERLGLRIDLARLAAEPTDGLTARWRSVLDVCRPFAIVLAALSLADGRKHPEELEVAVRFCALVCERRGYDLTDIEVQALLRYMKGLRPSTETAYRAIDRLLGCEPGEIVGLVRAGRAVIEADGLLHDAEVEMLDDIMREMTGVGLA